MPATSRIDPHLLRKAVRSASRPLVHRILSRVGPEELAQTLAELSPGELKFVVDLLLTDRSRLAQVLRALPDNLIPQAAHDIGDPLLARVLGVLDPDDAKQLVAPLTEDARNRVLELTDRRSRLQILRLLRYEPDSAAGRMTPHFVSVGSTATVGEAIRRIREAGPEVPLFYLYVVDDQEYLLGVTSLAQLVRSPDETPISQIMQTDIVSVPPEADQEAVARIVSRRNLLAVPVVEDGRLIGLVTIDDVILVLEQEATEDMYNMAGLHQGDRVFSAPHRSLLKRLPWNGLNLLTSLIAASVVGAFENTIGQLVVLATFMPVVAGIGGNTGNQTLTVILRGITLGELEFSSGLRALFKELLVGLSIGVILGVVVGLVATVWKGSAMLGLVVALALVANLFVAALVGTAIPLTLKRLGLDPALGGSILVTMCTDVFGFLSFLGLATLLMRFLL